MSDVFQFNHYFDQLKVCLHERIYLIVLMPWYVLCTEYSTPPCKRALRINS
jgi:hypothetical protein